MKDETWQRIIPSELETQRLVHRVTLNEQRERSTCKLGLLPASRAVQSPSTDIERWGVREQESEKYLEEAKPPEYPSRSDCVFLGLPRMELGRGAGGREDTLNILTRELPRTRAVIASMSRATDVSEAVRVVTDPDRELMDYEHPPEVRADWYWDDAILCDDPRECLDTLEHTPAPDIPGEVKWTEILIEGVIPPRAIERCRR